MGWFSIGSGHGQELVKVLLKTVSVNIVNRLPALSPRPLNVPKIIVDKENAIRFYFYYPGYVVKEAGISLTLPQVVTVEDVIKPSEEIVPCVKFVQYVRLIAENTNGDLFCFQLKVA